VDYRPQAAFWAKVGETIGHQSGVLALTTDYGYPLEYFGWQNSSPWPPAAEVDKVASTFRQLAQNKSFFVITDFDEFDRQPALKAFLRLRYPVLAQGKGYIVYDLLHRRTKTP
jgi:hypothetical protein